MLCSKVAMQLNSVYRLQRCVGKTERNITSNFIYSNFNYYPLAWHFCSCQSFKKFEDIQKGCPRLELNDYESDYATL